MLDVHISHFMEALTKEKTKASRRGLYVKFQKVWPTVKNEIDKINGRAGQVYLENSPGWHTFVKTCQ